MTESIVRNESHDRAIHILHPTDFSDQADVALAHALRLALANRSKLELLHVGKNTRAEWKEFPSIREFLQRWGMIEEGASRSAVVDLGIRIEKVISEYASVVAAIGDYCDQYPIDMLVLSTEGRHGLSAWLKPSKAEQIAEKVAIHSIPTLFVPVNGRGCVDVDSGAVSMERVLIPVDHQPASGAAVERGLRAMETDGDGHGELTLLYVGAEKDFPDVDVPEGPWRVQRFARAGNAAAEIVAHAEESNANLIIMVTEGTHGFLDALRGSTTQQVLHESPCPLLAVPAVS